MSLIWGYPDMGALVGAGYEPDRGVPRWGALVGAGYEPDMGGQNGCIPMF
jgi:hypothetical protein